MDEGEECCATLKDRLLLVLRPMLEMNQERDGFKIFLLLRPEVRDSERKKRQRKGT
jgi:hypothetical protein